MKDEMLQQLKPCPWCGSQNLSVDSCPLVDEHIWTTITCKTCGAESADQDCVDSDADFEIEQAAAIKRIVERWNTRCSDDPNACPLCGNTNIDQEGYEELDGTAECYILCNQGFAGDCHTHGPVMRIPIGAPDEEVVAILRASWTKRV